MAHRVPAQVLTTSGRFRDNRRGTVRVEETALGMVELVIDVGPQDGADAVTTRLVVSGAHLEELARELTRAARRDARDRAAAAKLVLANDDRRALEAVS